MDFAEVNSCGGLYPAARHAAFIPVPTIEQVPHFAPPISLNISMRWSDPLSAAVDVHSARYKQDNFIERNS